MLERICPRGGLVFVVSAPDVFVSHFAALTKPSFTLSCHPFTVSGSSAASTGAAQSRGDALTVGGGPAARFIAEYSGDPVRDAVAHGLPQLPMTLFAAFESARIASGLRESEVNLSGWYDYVPSRTRRDFVARFGDACEVLRRHAAANGEVEALERVIAAAQPAPAERLRATAKLWRSPSTIRFGTWRRGVNSVSTAAESIDKVLGDD